MLPFISREYAGETDKYRLGHIAPYVAMELITAEIPCLLQNFFYDHDKADASIFIKLLEDVSLNECNTVLCGYFEKIFECLVQHYPKEVY